MRMTITLQIDVKTDMPEDVLKARIKHELGKGVEMVTQNRIHALNTLPTQNAADALFVDMLLQEMIVEIQ